MESTPLSHVRGTLVKSTKVDGYHSDNMNRYASPLLVWSGHSLSAAFDLDLDFAGCPHGPVRSRGRAALQRRVKKKKIGKGTSSTRAASPLLVWSGHSCPLPLTLILTLISPERVRPCAIPWKSGASTPRQAPKPGTRLQPLRYAPRAHSVIPTGAGAPAQWRDLLSWPLISSRTPTR